MARIIVRLLIVAVVLATGAFCAFKLAAMKEAPPEKETHETPLTVKGVRAEYGNYTVIVHGYGTARCARRVPLSPETGGEVVYVRTPLEDGEIVDADEVLLRIDPRTYKLKLDAAEAEIAGLEAQVKRIEEQNRSDSARLGILKKGCGLAKSRHERLQNLYNDKNVGTLSEVETAEASFISQQNQVAVLEAAIALHPRRLAELAAALSAAKVQWESAKLNLDRCEIRAPFNGRLVDVRIEKYQHIIPGTAALTIVDDASIEIPVSLDSMEVLRWLVPSSDGNDKTEHSWYSGAAGASSIIRWAEEPDAFTWKGHVDRVEEVSPESRTVIAVVKPDAQDTGAKEKRVSLAEGMFLTIEIPSRHPVRCVRVPRSAVTHEGKVHTAVKGRLCTVPVKFIHEDADHAYIRGNIKEGDVLITTRLITPLEERLLNVVIADKEEETDRKEEE